MINITKSERKIVNSFLSLVNQKSVLTITNSDIIKKSGVAKGTFYHYFQSKEAIINKATLFINRPIMDRFVQRYRELGNPPMTPELLIDIFAETAIPIIYEHRDQIRVLHSSDVNELWRDALGQHYLRIMQKLFPGRDAFRLNLFNKYVYTLLGFWISNSIPTETHEFQREFKRSLTENMIENLK
ncbi:TetR/AcrR family transcriptional regulator [Lactobacillaceae bacterium Scapto_B20]